MWSRWLNLCWLSPGVPPSWTISEAAGRRLVPGSRWDSTSTTCEPLRVSYSRCQNIPVGESLRGSMWGAYGAGGSSRVGPGRLLCPPARAEKALSWGEAWVWKEEGTQRSGCSFTSLAPCDIQPSPTQQHPLCARLCPQSRNNSLPLASTLHHPPPFSALSPWLLLLSLLFRLFFCSLFLRCWWWSGFSLRPSP